MVYLVAFVCILSMAILHDFGRVNAGRAFSYWVSLTLLVLISGLRYKVGGDTQNYMYQFEGAPELSGVLAYGDATEKLQPLWILFVSTVKTISSSFYALQILHALIVNVSVFVFFRRATRYYFTAIAVYVIGAYPLFNFEIMRESLAISLFLWAYPAYRDARWKSYYVWAILAFLVHASALIVFLLPILRWRRPAFILTPIVFLIGIPFGFILRSLLGEGQGEAILGYASIYVDYVATPLGLLSLFISFVAFPFAMSRFSGLPRDKSDALRALIFTGIWAGATTSSFFIFFRFLNYFTPVYMVVASIGIHRLVKSEGSRGARASACICLLMFVFSFYSYRYFSDTSDLVVGTRWYNRWYPYYSILNEQEDPSRSAGQGVAP